MDRLGRDTRDLYNIVDELTSKGCAVEFVSERITVDKSGASPLEGLMLGILAAFAEFERRRIRERQAEGIALAKARGKYVQAPKLSDADVEQVKAMIQMGIPKAEVVWTFQILHLSYTCFCPMGLSIAARQLVPDPNLSIRTDGAYPNK